MAKIIIVGDRRTLRQKAFKAFNIPEQNAYIANTKERAAAEFFRAYPQEGICYVDAGSLELASRQASRGLLRRYPATTQTQTKLKRITAT